MSCGSCEDSVSKSKVAKSVEEGKSVQRMRELVQEGKKKFQKEIDSISPDLKLGKKGRVWCSLPIQNNEVDVKKYTLYKGYQDIYCRMLLLIFLLQMNFKYFCGAS